MALTVLYVSLTVFYLVLTVLYLVLTVLYVVRYPDGGFFPLREAVDCAVSPTLALTVLYMALTVFLAATVDANGDGSLNFYEYPPNP